MAADVGVFANLVTHEAYYLHHLFYNKMKSLVQFITESKENKTTNFITEASFIESKNRLILGTGPINPHEADEYITIQSLEKLVEQYKQIINDICC